MNLSQISSCVCTSKRISLDHWYCSGFLGAAADDWRCVHEAGGTRGGGEEEQTDRHNPLFSSQVHLQHHYALCSICIWHFKNHDLDNFQGESELPPDSRPLHHLKVSAAEQESHTQCRRSEVILLLICSFWRWFLTRMFSDTRCSGECWNRFHSPGLAFFPGWVPLPHCKLDAEYVNYIVSYRHSKLNCTDPGNHSQWHPEALLRLLSCWQWVLLWQVEHSAYDDGRWRKCLWRCWLG